MGLYIVSPVSDPDLWWHITSGKWILAHYQIPRIDYWNMFGVGKPWRAYSWSSEIILALIDRSFGISGLAGAQAALGVGVALAFCFAVGRAAKSHFIGALLGGAAALACFSHFSLRPQIVIWILFALLLNLSESIEKGRAGKREIAKIFLLMALWANTHLSAPLGLLGLFLFSFSPEHKSRAYLAVFVGFLGTLCTPYLGGEWITLFSKVSHPFRHAAVAEFQPATIMQYGTAFFVLFLGIVLLGLHYFPERRFLWKGLGLAIFSLGGLAVTKFLPFAIIYSAMFAARIYAEARSAGQELGNLSEALRRLQAFVSSISEAGLAWVFLCCAFLFVMKLKANPVASALIPEFQVDLIKERNLPGPLLNSFTYGGYLIYRLSNERGEIPEIYMPVVDGRTNVAPPEVFKKVDDALVGKENWRDIFDLVKPKTILWPKESPLFAILKEQADWCLLNEEGGKRYGFGLFVKKTGAACPEQVRREIGTSKEISEL